MKNKFNFYKRIFIQRIFPILQILTIIAIIPGIVISQPLSSTYCSYSNTLTWSGSYPYTDEYSTSLSPKYSNETINLTTNLVVNDDLTIETSNIKIASGKKIQIQAGKTLYLNRCKIFSCSGERWDGIEVLDNYGKLVMGSCYVEDADIAVKGFHNSIVDLQGNYFNRNTIALANAHADAFESFSLVFISNTIECTSALNNPSTLSSQLLYNWALYGVKFEDAVMTLGLDNGTLTNEIKDVNCGILVLNSTTTINGCSIHNTIRTNKHVIGYTIHGPVTSDVTYVHGGYGVWGEGSGSIFITGPTGYHSPYTIYNNPRDGLILQKGMNLDCQKVRFSENDICGINAYFGKKENTVFINKCSVKITTDHGLLGIDIDRSPGSGQTTNDIITYDTFNIVKPTTTSTNWAHALYLGGNSNATDFMDIKHNVLNLKGNINCHGIYYVTTQGTDFNRIIENVVTPDATSYGGLGIAVCNSTGAGAHNMVYSNSCLATSVNVGLGYANEWCGVHHLFCPMVHDCDNKVAGNTHGLHYIGMNTDLEVIINDIRDNFAGLRIDPHSVIGHQDCKANAFHLPVSDYADFAATAGDDPAAYKNLFTINKDFAVENPDPSVTHANWFIIDDACTSDIPSKTCESYEHEHMLVPDITTFDRLVADDEYDGEGGDSYLFEARLQIYNRYFDHYDVYSTFDTLEDFMSYNDTSIIGKISEVDRDIRDGLAIPDAVKTASASINTAYALHLKKLRTMDSLINVALSVSSLASMKRDSLVDTIAMDMAARETAYADYYDNRDEKLGDALDILNHLSTTSDCEFNAVITRRIYLESLVLQDGILNSNQIDTLIDIAEQCPDNGGHGVGNAQKLIPDSLLLSLSIWPYDDHCEETRPRENKQSKYLSHVGLKIYPNPTTGFISLNSTESIESVYIYTVEGKLVQFVEQINNNSYEMSIQNKGLYIVQVKDICGNLSNKKIIVH